MISALFELESLNITHRSLKPSNILIRRDNNGQICYKITDFCVSSLIDPMFIQSTLMDSGYFAPELFTTDIGEISRCDIWSLGVILLECAIGHYPFVNSNTYFVQVIRKEIYKKIETTLLEIPLELSDLISKILVEYTSSSKKRISATDLCKHPFIDISNSFSSLDNELLAKILLNIEKPLRQELKRVNKRWNQCITSIENNSKTKDQIKEELQEDIEEAMHWYGKPSVVQSPESIYKYDLRDELGWGNFGTVYKGTMVSLAI